MPSRSLVTLVGVALLAGCAGPTPKDELPPDHPANPRAKEASLPVGSNTLELPVADAGGTAPAGLEPSGVDAGAVQGHDHAAMTPANGASPTGHAAHGAQATAAVPMYSCPMHPEVVSANRCPKCNMKINKPVKAGATAPAMPGGHSGHAPGGK